MKSGILIAFMGTRGSGKTTIANTLATKLNADGYFCARQHQGLSRRPFWQRVYTALTLWRYFDWELMQMFGFVGRPPRRWPSIYRLYMPLALAHDLRALRTGETDVLIYDSNILRGLMNAVVEKKLSLDQVAEIYQRKIVFGTKKVVLVVVKTDPVISVKRWIDRDQVSLTELEYQSSITERLTQQTLTEEVAEALAGIDGVHVVWLDGSLSPKDNAELVLAMTKS